MSDWADGLAGLGDLFGGYDDPSALFPPGYFDVPDPGFTGGYDDPSALYPGGWQGISPPPFDGGYDDPRDLYPNGWQGISPGAGSNPSDWMSKFASFAKAMGITPASLLQTLLMAGGGLYATNQNSKATQQALEGINKANDEVKSILGGQTPKYDPYISAGTNAVNTMANAAPSNLAGNYKPLYKLSYLAKGQ